MVPAITGRPCLRQAALVSEILCDAIGGAPLCDRIDAAQGSRTRGLRTEPPTPPQPGDGKDYRLAWKSIESLGRLGLVLESLPDARSVHIVRHPCGYVASVLRGEAAARFDHNAAAADFPIYEMLSGTAPARRRGLRSIGSASCPSSSDSRGAG